MRTLGGVLVSFFIWNRIGFIGGDEVRVFDAISGRPAGPADLERIFDLGSALRATPNVLSSDLADLEAETTHR